MRNDYDTMLKKKKKKNFDTMIVYEKILKRIYIYIYIEREREREELKWFGLSGLNL